MFHASCKQMFEKFNSNKMKLNNVRVMSMSTWNWYTLAEPIRLWTIIYSSFRSTKTTNENICVPWNSKSISVGRSYRISQLCICLSIFLYFILYPTQCLSYNVWIEQHICNPISWLYLHLYSHYKHGLQ